MRVMPGKLYGGLIISLLFIGPCIVAGLDSAFAQSASSSPRDAVIFMLSGRHLSATRQELETAAGGEDAFVSILLDVRTMDSPPALGIRAEKLLMSYSERPEVQEALLSDINSERYLGLARVITAHLDNVGNPQLRMKLGRQALDRAEREKRFRPYAKVLLESKDPELKRLARRKLGTR